MLLSHISNTDLFYVLSTGILQYLWGTDSRTAMDTKICGYSSPLNKLA